MQIIVLFINIGSYHAARLRAAHQVCQDRGWNLIAVQLTDDTLQHPWGDLKDEINFPLKTLLPVTTSGAEVNWRSCSQDGARALRSLLDQLDPDAVFLPGWGFSVAQAGLQWCRHQQVPAILMSESKVDDEKRTWWRELLKSRLYVRQFDAALVGGKQHLDYVVKLGIPSERVFLGYDAVDNDYFTRAASTARSNPAQARDRQPLIPKQPYFICLTRFLERKNISNLIAAYADYRDRLEIKAWDLVICGSGEQETQIKSLIHSLGLTEVVHLPGFISYGALGDWYGLAAAFIHPALQEQWGLVVNEACAAGLPILSSHTVGAARELVRTHQNGFLFDPVKVDDITQAMINVQRLDPSTRIKMGQRSQQIVADYGPQRFAAGLVNAVDIALAC